MTWFKRSARPDEDLSDEQAMLRVRAVGDPVAFARLVERWQTPIRRLCVRMTGDEHRGEDLAQDAFARVFANRGRYDETRRFSTWLWRIALNLCYEDGRRRRSQEAVDVREIGVSAEAGPHEHAVAAERVSIVRQALARLPEAHRAVVVLREYENLKFREIAEVLEMPEGTVKWRMSEAMDQLSKTLAPTLGEREAATSRPDAKQPLLKVAL